MASLFIADRAANHAVVAVRELDRKKAIAGGSAVPPGPPIGLYSRAYGPLTKPSLCAVFALRVTIPAVPIPSLGLRA